MERNNNFLLVPRHILSTPEFTGSEKAVYFSIFNHANCATRIAYPEISTIMDETGLSNKTVAKAIQTLVDHKAIARKKERRGNRERNIYKINILFRPKEENVRDFWITRKKDEWEGEWEGRWEETGEEDPTQGYEDFTQGCEIKEPCAEKNTTHQEIVSDVGVKISNPVEKTTQEIEYTKESISNRVQPKDSTGEDIRPTAKKYKGWVEPVAIVKAWNDITEGVFPHVYKLTDDRKKKIRARQEAFKNDKPEEDARQLPFWETIFKAMITMPFLKGENNRGWEAYFDFVIRKDETLVNLIEGKYASQKEEWVDVR